MGLRKAIGIMVFATQLVVSADYILQTRDAGLGWGEMSGAQYAAIVQARFTGPSASALAVAGLPRGNQGGSPGADNDSAGSQSAAAEPGICVRRGTALACD